MNFVLSLILRLVTLLAKIGSFPLFILEKTASFVRKIIFRITRFTRKIVKNILNFILNVIKSVAKGIRKAIKAVFRFIKGFIFFLKRVLFNRFVLFGFATLLLVSSAYELGLREGKFQHQKMVLAQREAAPLKVFDRNGTLLYSTTVGNFETTAPSATEYKRAPGFVLSVLQSLTKQFGSKIFNNGVLITTTLDMKLQTAAQEAVIEQVVAANATDGSLLVVNSQTGDILAFVDSIHYFDQPTQPLDMQNKFIDIIQIIQAKKLNPFLSLTDKNGKGIFSKKIEVVNDIDVSVFKSVTWNPDESTITTIGNYLVWTSLKK